MFDEIRWYSKGYIWLLIALVAVLLAVEVKDMLVFFIRRFRFRLRLLGAGCAVEGCYPLWWLFPRSGRTSFFVRAKSGTLYAVKLVGSHYPGTEYALTSTAHWCCARWVMLLRIVFCLGFRRMLHNMDFRWDAELRHKESVPVWLFTPKPYCLSDRPHEEKYGKYKEYGTGQAYDGILIADGATFFGMLQSAEAYSVRP